MKKNFGETMIKAVEAIHTVVQMRVDRLRHVSTQLNRVRTVQEDNMKAADALQAKYAKRG